MSCWLGCAGCPDCTPDYTEEQLNKLNIRAQKKRKKQQERSLRKYLYRVVKRAILSIEETMAKGEARYNPLDRQIKKFTFRTIPTKDYTLQAKPNTWSVAVKNEPHAIPYVVGFMNALNTKEEGKEDSKDVSLRKMLFLSLSPGKDKDGNETSPNIDNQGGFSDLCQKLNVAPPDEYYQEMTFTDDEGNETTALNAKKIADWLNTLGEFVVKAHVRLKPPKPPNDAQNEISYFIEDEVNTKFGEEAKVTELPTGTGKKKK